MQGFPSFNRIRGEKEETDMKKRYVMIACGIAAVLVFKGAVHASDAFTCPNCSMRECICENREDCIRENREDCIRYSYCERAAADQTPTGVQTANTGNGICAQEYQRCEKAGEGLRQCVRSGTGRQARSRHHSAG